MPTKRNSAGEQQEYYPAGSPKGGQFASSGGQGSESKKSSINTFTDDLLDVQADIHELPEEHQTVKPIVEEKDFENVRNSIKIVGKDGKEYSYNEPFIKEWIAGVDEKAKKYETFNKKNKDTGDMDPSRVAFDEKEIQKEIARQEEQLRKNGIEPKYERKATFVFGLPAAGKSRLSDPLKQEMGAFEIDADLMKQHIPEFQKDPQMVSAVHEESSWMSKKMNKQLRDKGANLVIGKVGGEKNYDSILSMMKELKEAGYDIDIQVAHKDLDKALEANLGRFINRYNDKENWGNKPPRIVRTSQHFNTQKTYFETAIKLFNQGLVSGYKFIDVNDSKNPKLIHEKRK